MCYKSPGPRCSSYAKKELAKAEELYTEALKTGDAHLAMVAHENLIEARKIWYATPGGQKELKKEIAETGDPTGELNNQLDYGILMREEAMRLVKEQKLQIESHETVVNTKQTEENTMNLSVTEQVQRIEAAINERVNSEEFIGYIAERDRTRNERKALQAEIAKLNTEIEENENVAEGRIPRPRADGPTLAEVVAAQDALDDQDAQLRILNDKHLDAFYAYHVANNNLEKYKDETALKVAEINELLGDPGIAYESDRLGNAREVASYDSGSREWLEERQGGIGGSDIGSMLRLDPEFGQSNYIDFIKSKTEPYSEAEVAAQADANSGFSGPTGRGNAWEPAIVRRYIEENPGQSVMFSKASWVKEDDAKAKLNVDGLLSDDGVTPNGILEIKTASDMEHWEHVNEDGSITPVVPLGYRAQVLWYLRNTGFEYADIAVQVDDRDYRQRRIYAYEDIDPYNHSIVGNLEENMHTIERVWADEVVARNNGTRAIKENKSTFEKAHESKTIFNHAAQLAAWREISISEATAIIKNHRKGALGDAKAGIEGGSLTDRMTAEFKKGGPSTWTKDLISVDIETSGMGPNSGEIIEIGIRRTNSKGETVTEYEERFGLRDERILDIKGTGAEEVHKIAPDDIRGKRSFSHPEVQAIVKSYLMDDNGVAVAHNKAFEERWFDQYLPGFRHRRRQFTTARYQAQRAGLSYPEPVPIIDTMYHSRYLTPNSPNNRLASFTVANGIPYVDAHSALPDAQMTQRALFNHEQRIRGDKFVSEL